MPFLILLPILACILLTLALAKNNFAHAFIQAHLIIFAFIAVSTEVLSFFRAIEFTPILIGWILFLLFCGFLLAWRIRTSTLTLPAIRLSSPFGAVLTTGILVLPGATLTSALLYPPNTWDSMTYHMTRVVHWINNESVAFYPTAITRQLYQMPLAEYGILHLQLLTGGDVFANLIQWVNFPVLICLAYLTAEELGLSERERLISAAVMASLPMGIIQASSTQNDLITASFLCAFAFYLLRILQSGLDTAVLKLSPNTKKIITAYSTRNLSNIFFAALAFGLALLTKGTSFFFSAGIGVSLGLAILFNALTLTKSPNLPTRKNLFWHSALTLAVIVLLGLSLNLPHFWRNYRVYGNPLSTESEEYANKNISLKTLGSNLLRNAAVHLGTPFESLNAAQYRAIESLLGAELNNPETTWLYSEFEIPNTREETTAGNLLHMLIILAGLILIPIHWIKFRDLKFIAYAGAAFSGWLIYCWMVNWQLWASRLHTPLFALSAPLIALTLGKFGKRAESLFTIAFLIYALPYALQNENRPLLSMEWKHQTRTELYFFPHRSNLLTEYESAIQSLEGYTGEVGLFFEVDTWEYPLWVLTNQTVPQENKITFRHVGIKNPSGKISPDVQPQYVIAAKAIDKWKFWREYELIYQSKNLSVFQKK